MADYRSIEEYVKGLEGDASTGLEPVVVDVLKQAEELGFERIQCECRIQSGFKGRTRQDWTCTFLPGDPLRQILNAIQTRLIQSPGEEFYGALRLNFRNFHDLSQHLRSHSRRMRPSVDLVPDNSEVDEEGNLVPKGASAREYADLVRPHAEMTMRVMGEATHLVHACAKLVEAMHPPAPQGGNGEGGFPLGNLLDTAVGIAKSNSAAEMAETAVRAGSRVLKQPVWSGTVQPPAPLPMIPMAPAPSPGTTESTTVVTTRPTISTEDVRRWATANPGAAKGLMREALLSGGK
jgi:hypothetical protein